MISSTANRRDGKLVTPRASLRLLLAINRHAYHHPSASPAPADPTLAAEALEFIADRDLLKYATELMAAIEDFVNHILDAFATDQAVTL